VIELDKLKQLAKKNEKENKRFVKNLISKKPKDLDKISLSLHNQAFKKIDCLDCAYCCKSLGPRITDKDIDRISKFLKLSKDKFISNYLVIDEDKDFVFANMPCPFLMDDNYCFIYDVRPKACKEYPHTDRKRFHQVLNLSVTNTFTCPAVFEVIEGLKEHYK
jgi:Fe-S-cluster containining protein